MVARCVRSLRSVVRTGVTVFLCFALVSLVSIQVRYGMAVAGLLELPQANASEHKSPVDGKHVVPASYCSEAIALNDPQNASGCTSTDLMLDDAWLKGDPQEYNHDLATACAVLSAVCNSESQFYGSIEGAVPYVEKTLGSLGFEDVHTESYALRSNIFDQIGAFFAGSHDVAAYAFASKTVAGENGEDDETIIFVGVRGSYGAEWLSNFKLGGDAEGGSDHWGSKMAETEIMESLTQYAREIGADPACTKILVTGHSRGGAVANLLAADLDDRSGDADAIAVADSIFAYTFAAPGSTQSTERDNLLYGNIFNITNPADVVPSMPLVSWGYGCYGNEVSLPDAHDEGFSASYRAMQETYRSNTGFANPCKADDLKRLSQFDSNVAQAFPSLDALLNPLGIANAVRTVFELDPAKALSAHYPDTYIAWMQSIDSRQLSVV